MPFKFLDLVRPVGKSCICVVLLGPLEIPYFHDGVASGGAFIPLDIENPEEWANTFTGYVLFNTSTASYQIDAEHGLELCPGEYPHLEAYMPLDQATSRTRLLLGLLKLSEKWSGRKGDNTEVMARKMVEAVGIKGNR